MSGDAKSSWRIVAGRVRGAAHRRLGQPNQDALAYAPKRNPGPPLVIALADGHGSPASFRSAFGAQLAVSLTVHLLQKSALSVSEEQTGEETAWPGKIAEQIVTAWQEQILTHLSAYPITDEEWQRVKENGTNRQAKALEQNPLLAYGTTLLAVRITPHSAYCMQLGDGDILTVRQDGEVQRVFPHDERHIANETTSLCMPQAWHEVRTADLVYDHFQTALIMASTDGYANSFRNEAAFLQAGQDFLTLLRRYGVPFIRRRLSTWLNQTSRSGSGDDISLGILYRQDSGETI